MINITDEQVVKRANAAVKAEQDKSFALDVPIVVYDRETQKIYNEYADGTRVEIGSRILKGRYSERAGKKGNYGAMKKVYPIFTTNTDDCILVEVPDLGIITQGNGFTDALDMAVDAIQAHIESLINAGEEIPEPSKIMDISVDNAKFKNDGITSRCSVEVTI